MEIDISDMVRQIAVKFDEELAKVPSGWLLCMHERATRLFSDPYGSKYTITQRYHIIHNSADCPISGMKTQYGPMP